MKRSRIGAGLLKLYIIVGLSIYVNEQDIFVASQNPTYGFECFGKYMVTVSWLCMDLVYLDFLEIFFV